MKLYSVYTNPTQNAEPILIEQGRSYVAGIFNILWALYHRMWFVAFFTIIVDAVIRASVLSLNSQSFAYVAEFSIILVYFLFASDMREYSAKRRGYVLADILVATDPDEAEMKFFHRVANSLQV